jgi:glycosyltransferase involved in cell wall biosynthesis
VPRAVIDLRMVSGRMHGIARYALELGRRLPALLPEWELWALTGPQGLPLGIDLPASMSQAACRAEFLSAWEQPALRASLATLKPDLFHATSFSLPALWRGRLLATLHDANHLALPQYYGLAQRAYYRWVVAPRVASAAGLLTVSAFSRAELSRYLRLPLERFEVIPLGVSNTFAPPSPTALEAFRARHGLPPLYFAAVGNPKPHKNLRLLAQLAPSLPAPVALVAGSGAARAIDLGELEEEEMALFYGGAISLLLPSLYEGFGLPGLEAMASGCPLMAARTSALAEWVGDGGILLDPQDAESWKAACLLLIQNPKSRESWVERGRSRARAFTWESCARQTAQAYRRVV